MASSRDIMKLRPDSAYLSPLPTVLHQGLTAVAVLACLSFLTSGVTVIYLTYKLIKWRIGGRGGKSTLQTPNPDFSLGLASRHFGGADEERRQTRQAPAPKRSPNQFLILLYNLLIADLHQSGSFLLNAVWVGTDSIQVGSGVCFLQGWLVSNGDVAGGLFLSAIAIHTYVTVVWNYKPKQWAVYAGIIGIWVFTYVISALGIIITRNGRDGGGFYVRAGPWVSFGIMYDINLKNNR